MKLRSSVYQLRTPGNSDPSYIKKLGIEDIDDIEFAAYDFFRNIEDDFNG